MKTPTNSRLLAIGSVLLFTLGSCSSPEEEVYLYATFSEPATSGLQYMFSEDGLHWDSVPGTFLMPEIGGDTCYTDAFTGELKDSKPFKHRILRDPSILQSQDGTFHLVWTTQWFGGRSFGYSSSKDLKNWTEQRLINVMQNHPTNNVWAPEIFYDDVQDQYLIIWASQIAPSEYTEADRLGKNQCQRLWYCITKDFETFTDAMPYYDPGFNSIDAFLLKRGRNDYVLIVKDNRKPEFSNLFCVFSDSPYGPFRNPTQAFTPSYCEGPCAIKLNQEWVIYYDHYKPDQYLSAVSTTDFSTFTPIPERISIPTDKKHGTIIKIKRSQLNGLLFQTEEDMTINK